jgi:hypothetical protein
MASKFRVTKNSIWIDELRYRDIDNVPVYIEDSMLLNMDAIETYMILHRNEENEEVSENRDGSSSST